MVSKLSTAIVAVILLSMVTTGVVFADEQTDQNRVRFIGEITEIDLDSSSFTLLSHSGRNLRFVVGEGTVFRSRDGSIQGLRDLSIGMKALVSAIRNPDGYLEAEMVTTSNANELPVINRSAGTITSVNSDEGSFVLESREGQLQEFAVGPRTRYRSRDGSIKSLADVEPGMQAIVASVAQEGQKPQALMIGIKILDEPSERFNAIGEIINVVPGQGTFDLETRNGRLISFTVTDRTKFRSRDGSIEDIHDLKKGMHAVVVGVESEEGNLLALGIAAADPEEIKDIAKLDVRALGKITSIGDQTFTMETKNQGSLTFSVDSSTRFISHNNAVGGLEDLQEGMIVVVGAKELGNGDLKAVFVGVRLPTSDRISVSPDDLTGETPMVERR
jgi:hypothetical protein